MWKRLASGLLELIAPSRCAACAAAMLEPGFCGACALLLEFEATGSRRARSACVYGGPLADALQRLKYEGKLEVLQALTPLLLDTLEGLETELDLVTAIPMTRARLWARGFNQSALLALAAARALGVPFRPRALVRVRSAAPQVGRDRAERARALQGGFSARSVAGLRVLVVDDVRTTGATLAEAERALYAAGAQAVLLRSLAQTPDA